MMSSTFTGFFIESKKKRPGIIRVALR